MWDTALPSFLIGLREGLEAGLIVSILIATVVRAGEKSRLPQVWTGVTAAIALALSFGAILTFSAANLSTSAQETFGGTLSVIAVGFVTAMVFWMRRSARNLSSEIKEKVTAALTMGSGVLITTSFLAVGREGLETALFLWTNAKAAGQAAGPMIGGAIGLVLAGGLCWGLYRRVLKINLSKFFTYTGLVLIVIAAGVLAYGLRDLQEGGVLPGNGALAVHLSDSRDASSWYGTLLQGVFNLSPQMTWLQVVAYGAYLAVVMPIFLRGTLIATKPAAAPAAPVPAKPAPATTAPAVNGARPVAAEAGAVAALAEQASSLATQAASLAAQTSALAEQAAALAEGRAASAAAVHTAARTAEDAPPVRTAAANGAGRRGVTAAAGADPGSSRGSANGTSAVALAEAPAAGKAAKAGSATPHDVESAAAAHGSAAPAAEAGQDRTSPEPEARTDADGDSGPADAGGGADSTTPPDAADGSSPRRRWLLPAAVIAVPAVVAGAVIAGTGGKAAAQTIAVSPTECGKGFTAPKPGQQTFQMQNTGTQTSEVYLINPATNAVYGEIEGLAPGTTRTLVATVGSGSYAWRCVPASGRSVTSAAVQVSGGGNVEAVLPVTEQDLAGPLAQYKAYVNQGLATLAGQVKTLQSDISGNNLSAAKGDWLTAHLTYASLGAAYGTFADYDGKINGRADGLPGGVSDPGFTGFHRLEYGLWHGESDTSLQKVADQLVTDVTGLQKAFPTQDFDVNDLSLRTHEILENTLQFELTGDTDEGSGTNLATAQANLQGTQELLSVLRDLIAKRSPHLLGTVDADIQRLSATLAAQHTSSGWTPVQQLSTTTREQLNGVTGQLLEDLSPIPDLLEIRKSA
jgi:high-affinity iron transporter